MPDYFSAIESLLFGEKLSPEMVILVMGLVRLYGHTRNEEGFEAGYRYGVEG